MSSLKGVLKLNKEQYNDDQERKRRHTFAIGDLVSIAPHTKRPKSGWKSRKGEVGTVVTILSHLEDPAVYIEFPRFQDKFRTHELVHVRDVNRKEYFETAKFLHRAMRYEDCLGNVEAGACIVQGKDLSVCERSMLSKAFKAVFRTYEKSANALLAVAAKTYEEGKRRVIAKYLLEVTEEYMARIEESIFLIEKVLLPNAHRTHNSVNIVFLYKIKGDMLRRIHKFYPPGNPRGKIQRRSHKAYMYGLRLAKRGEKSLCGPLDCANAIRLSIALNFSVYLHDIEKSPQRAIGHTKKAFDDATSTVEFLPEREYKNSMAIMSQMRDNLDRWTNQIVQESSFQTVLWSNDATGDRKVGVLEGGDSGFVWE